MSGLYVADVERAIFLAIDYLPLISNLRLRESIRDRLENSGIIKIRTTWKQDRSLNFFSECYVHPERAAYAFTRPIKPFFKIGEITLCMTNIVDAGRLSQLWEYLVHEFAHTCGWEHYENCGVPGIDGCM